MLRLIWVNLVCTCWGGGGWGGKFQRLLAKSAQKFNIQIQK
jgi:hypothetical protein